MEEGKVYEVDVDDERVLDLDPLSVGVHDEYSQLESVFIHIPRKQEVVVNDPEKVMFSAVPNYNELIDEVDAYIKLLTELGITVYHDGFFREPELQPFPNAIYQRDLAVIGPDNTVFLANPKYNIRKGEEQHLLFNLRRWGFFGRVVDLEPRITMEGADFFWVNKNKVIISVGNRTSPDFIEVFSGLYPDVEVMAVEAAAEGIPQHILGCKHIVNEDTIISRNSINGDDLGFANIIEMEETDEIVNGYAMNVVTIGPNEIIMPSGNPETKAIYESHGIKCHETPCKQIGKMSGAIACMTLPLKRKMHEKS